MNRLFLSFLLSVWAMIAAGPDAKAWTADSVCAVVATNSYATRMQCNFGIGAPIPNAPITTINYASGSCTSTATGSFSVRQFQVVVTPPRLPPPAPQAPVSFQLPIAATPVGFVNGSYTFAAAVVSISAAAVTPATAFIDIVSPSVGRNVLGCTVSFSGD